MYANHRLHIDEIPKFGITNSSLKWTCVQVFLKPKFTVNNFIANDFITTN